MGAPITRLFAYYKAYHDHGPLLLRYLSLLGLVGYPLMYSVRFIRPTAGYDDLVWRVVDAILCLGLFLRPHWPERLKPYYPHYSYVVLIVVLPVTFVFTSLKHGGNQSAVANTFFAAFLLMLLADWRNLIVMLVAGAAIGGGLYFATDPAPRMPPEYIARLPLLIVGMVGGSLFKFGIEEATAERVRRAYASLAGSIAHEMRNPMAQVRYSLENIRQALPITSVNAQPQLVDGHTVDTLYRHVAQGEMAVKRGLQVISMTLDQVNAKPLDAGKLVYLSAGEVCAKAVEEYGYENEQQRAAVSLAVKEDFVFRGDETAFVFLLFNLLKNALYYLPAYPHARIELIVAGGRICVRDTGPGIAPEVLTRLFQPFRTSGKHEGTGLGLAYCRRVMQAFGGDIQCDSIEGLYTRFTMTFPPVGADELAAQQAAAMAEARRIFGDRRILVVDDDAGIRAATRLKLLELRCTVREAADGVEAMQALQESVFDAVVVDLNMPRMDGYELAEYVRSGRVPPNRDACLVAYTSEPAHIARVKTGNAGFDGFVGKPCDQVALVRALCSAMEARERSRGRARGWLTGRRFLLADDNAYNRTAVGAYLKHAGADVVEVGSGQAVLRELDGPDLFDAVLLDIHMPGMDGIQTARAVRTAEMAQSSVPLLAITAHADASLVAAARAAGIADFLTKPVEPPVLYEKLAALMGVRAPNRPPPREPARADALLDENRLEGYERIGMLEELVDEFVPEIDSLVERLHEAVAREDVQAALDTLHSLVGMSGEAGAQALYRYCREVYVPMLESRAWPAAAGWDDRIRALAVDTTRALRGWTAGRTSQRA